MKKVISILALGLALLMVSCQKENTSSGSINEITDLYTVPADAVPMAELTASKSTWSTDRRYFDLTFGSALSTTLVGYDALLAPGQYVLGGDEKGNAILAKTKLNGQAAKEGYITVGKLPDGKYAITAHIDGEILTWTGTLPFVPDPAPLALSVVLSAQSNVGSGTNSLTMNLAQEGISSSIDYTTWQTVWHGNGQYLALDLYSADGYLHVGEYKPSAKGGEINPGEFGIGWDPGDIYSIGYEFTNWGTCIWTVTDGTTTPTAEKVTTGMVTVDAAKVDGQVIWTISWGVNYPVEYQFVGAIPALTEPDKPAGPVEPDYLYTEEITAGDVDKHAITITDKEMNVLAYLELLMAPGETNYEGSYPSTSYASQPGQMCDGYNFPDWGIAGGSWYMSGDEKVYIGAGAATVVVTKIAEGAYSFTCAFFDYACAGPDYVPGEGGGGDDDVTGDVVLKLTSGLSYSMEDKTAENTTSSGAALSGVTLWRVAVSDGSSTVASFDLVVSAGSEDITGEFTVMSYPDAVGKAGNGWGFPAYGMVGGCYFVVSGSYYWIPSDATINVSANSDGTLKFKFEGAIQKEDYSDGGQGGLLLNNVAKK